MTGRSKTDDYSFRKEGTSIVGALSLLLTSLGVIIGAIPLPTVLSGTKVVIAIVVAWIGVIASLVIFARSAFAIASGMHSNRERILKRIASTLWIEIFRPADYDIGFIDRPGLNEYWTEMERLAQTVMGQDFAHGVLSKEKVQMHVDKNVQSVLGVFSKAMGNRSLVGFAIIIALKKGATQDIMEGKIRTGHDISDAHVSPNPLRAGSLYIAGIYAQG
jgi:hypothetical protein